MSVRLFVGNLPYDVTETELREHFSQAGEVSYVSIPVDRDTGKRRGFAFVEFSDSAQAAEAIRQFNNQMFKGRSIAVNEARARESRPPGAPPRSSSSASAGRPRTSEFRPFAPDAPPEQKRDWRSRKFGPDARPARSRGLKGRPKTEGKKKGPIPERHGGQFFSTSDDERYEDLENEELGNDVLGEELENDQE